MATKVVPLSQYVQDLGHALSVATFNFDVWWTYKQRRDRARFLDVLNEYPLFFRTSIHAHFVAMIVALYRVYETRTDTFNLSEVMKRVESDHILHGRKLTGLKRRVNAARRLWVRVSILRNEAFGHRTNARSVTDVFRKASVTGNELRKLIRKSKDVVGIISYALDRSRPAADLRAVSDTRRMLTDLKELDTMRSNPRLKATRRKRASALRASRRRAP